MIKQAREELFHLVHQEHDVTDDQIIYDMHFSEDDQMFYLAVTIDAAAE